MLGNRTEPEAIISEYELTGAVLYSVFGIQPKNDEKIRGCNFTALSQKIPSRMPFVLKDSF